MHIYIFYVWISILEESPRIECKNYLYNIPELCSIPGCKTRWYSPDGLLHCFFKDYQTLRTQDRFWTLEFLPHFFLF